MTKKRKKPDPLISVLEHALDLGEFVSYNRSWDFVRDLEDVKHKIDELVKEGNAELLEQFSHHTTEKAANGLAKKHELAAAKIYSALGMRIVKKGKSKYYQYALEHFRKTCKLYEKAGRDQLWIDIVERVRRDHSRKYCFIGYFEEIVD